MKKTTETIEIFYQVLILYSRIRLTCWPLFAVLFYGLNQSLGDMISIYQNLSPWETFYASLGFMDTIRFYLLGPVIFYMLYLGYRCIVNEFDSAALQLNRQLNGYLFK